MKTFRLLAAATFTFVLLSISNVQAQPKEHNNWLEKMRSEKVAFLTSELDLSPAEAQVFWPVYNQITKERHETQKAAMKAYFDLTKAIEDGNVSDKEIDKLLNEYVAATEANKSSYKSDIERYRKVLPSKKIAKLYVAEEKFRRNHIRAMRTPQGPGQGKPAPGPKR